MSTELGMTFVEECDPPDGQADQTKTAQPARAALAPRVLDLIKAGEMSRPDIARELGRTPKDGTVRRVVEALVQAGEIEVFDGLYKGVPGASSLKGSGTVAPHSEANVERWKRIASDDEAEPR